MHTPPPSKILRKASIRQTWNGKESSKRELSSLKKVFVEGGKEDP